jgi:hypothetical protein
MQGQLMSRGSDEGVDMSTWRSRQGLYSGRAIHREPVVGGEDWTTYRAGPYRTQYRAEAATEALGARAYRGQDIRRYRESGPEHVSHQELHGGSY